MSNEKDPAAPEKGVLKRIARVLRHGHTPEEQKAIDAEAAAEEKEIGNGEALERPADAEPIVGHGTWGFGLGTPVESDPGLEHARTLRLINKMADHKPPPPQPPPESEGQIEWKFFEPADPKEEK